jgi:hypothetical protein
MLDRASRVGVSDPGYPNSFPRPMLAIASSGRTSSGHRASVRHDRRAQGDHPTLRSITPTRATARPVFETGSERADSIEIKAFSSHQEPLAPDLLHDTCQTDPGLARIVEVGPTLPEAVHAGIVAMVQAAAK